MSKSIASTERRVSAGTVADGFEAVKTRLDSFLLADASYSAQLAIYWRGELVVDLAGGPDTDLTSLTGVFSCSKGMAGLALSALVDRGVLDVDQPVAAYWPEFAEAGKDAITARQFLSHQAGVLGVDEGVDWVELCDSRDLAKRLAASAPVWRPGAMFGYHGIAMGVFLEETFRRLTDGSVQAFFEEAIRGPRDLDFYLGLPEEQEARYRDVLPMRLTAAQAAEQAARPGSPDGLGSLANGGAVAAKADGAHSPLWPNIREFRRAGFAAGGGVGSARGLAGAYASVFGFGGQPALFGPETMALMTQEQVWGTDRVLNKEMAFALVFMKPHPTVEFGSYRAFGHDGASGALGFADPTYDLAFGYVPQALQYPGGGDPKAVELSRVARHCITNLR